MVTLQTSVSVQKNVIPSRKLLGNIHFPWNHRQKHHSGKISYFLFPHHLFPWNCSFSVEPLMWIEKFEFALNSTVWEKQIFSLTEKYFVKPIWFVCTNVNFTKFLSKSGESKMPQFSHCVQQGAIYTIFLAVLLWYYM